MFMHKEVLYLIWKEREYYVNVAVISDLFQSELLVVWTRAALLPVSNTIFKMLSFNNFLFRESMTC